MKTWMLLATTLLTFAPSLVQADIFDVITTISSGGTNLIQKKNEDGSTQKNVVYQQGTDPKTRLDVLDRIPDRKLVTEFYVLSKDGEQESVPAPLGKDGFSVYELEPGRLILKKETYKAGSLDEINQLMLDDYVSEAYSDALAKRYIAFAKKRGNQVKLYRALLDLEVVKAIEQGTGYLVKYNSQKKAYFGLDNVLIEYTPEGEVVSIMERHSQVSLTIGAQSTLFVQLIFGRRIIQTFENAVSFETMRDMFIRAL